MASLLHYYTVYTNVLLIEGEGSDYLFQYNRLDSRTIAPTN